MARRSLSPLDTVAIARRCPAPGYERFGLAKVTHCEQCDREVHNLSMMTRAEAESFLRDARASERRACIAFSRGPDRRVITRDDGETRRPRRRLPMFAAFALCAAIVGNHAACTSTGIAPPVLMACAARADASASVGVHNAWCIITSRVAARTARERPETLGVTIDAGMFSTPEPPSIYIDPWPMPPW